MTKLSLKDLSIAIDRKYILRDINLKVEEGKFVGIIGLNGTGKSSLLKAIYGIYPYAGEIFVDAKNLKNVSIKEQARVIAVLVQEHNEDFDFKVWDVVMMGRLPYQTLFQKESVDDYAIVERALELVGLWDFRDRYFSTLSGGEKQRVLIARVMAQQTEFLILDEPTNHLDIRNQFYFFEMVKSLKLTVLAVLHDLNLAAHFCDYIYVLHHGKIWTQGRPEDVFRKEMLHEVFGMKTEIHRGVNGRMYIEYYGVS